MASGFNNGRDRKEMGRKMKYLSSLCQACENVAITLDYNEALSSLVKNAAHCLNAKASSIRLIDKTGKILEIAATYGLSRRYLRKGPVEIARSPIDKRVLQGKIVQIKDVTKDQLFQYPREAKKEGIKSVLCLPLKCRERLLAVLRIYSDKERVFSDEEITIVSTFASQGAAVIKNAQRYQRLKSLSALGKTITSQLEIKPQAKKVVKDISCFKVPDFHSPTEYVALTKPGEYAINEGNIVSSKGLKIAVDDYKMLWQNNRQLKAGLPLWSERWQD